MLYQSTRGGMPAQNFSKILLEGLAPDGGLAVPEKYPQYNYQKTAQNNGLYNDFALDVLALYAPEIPQNELLNIINNVYNPQVFKSSSITPFTYLDENTAILELSNGPTFAFKDLALQLLGELFSRQLHIENRSLNIIAATSGDTGSAAEYAMRGRKNINVFMLSPKGRMSAFQQAQMYSLQDKNIFNLAVDGVFDYCQSLVKTLSQDLEFKARAKLGAVNSINWGRICAQVVYYFYGFTQAIKQGWQADKISFVVPSGNFGNVLAGHVARQMGLPINRLIVATNENNVLEEGINNGVYRPRNSHAVIATSSPSMDIAAASNFERYVFDICERDPERLNNLWKKLARDGYINFKDEGIYQRITDKNKYPSLALVAGASNHKLRLQTIKSVYGRFNRIIDPHTADGYATGEKVREVDEKLIILETAQPIKFLPTINEALGAQPEIEKQTLEILQLRQTFTEVDKNPNFVREFIEKHI